MKKNEKITIKPSLKYKMDEDELKMHLHLQRKGAYVGKDNSKYKRKEKYPKRTRDLY